MVLGAAVILTCAASVLAHETKIAGSLRLTIGWGDEPAFTGLKNAVEVAVADAAGRPVTDLGESFAVEIAFGDQRVVLPLQPVRERPGTFRAWLVPTRSGAYAFRFTGTARGQIIDTTSTCSPKTFSCVADLSDLQFPVKDPSAGQLAERVTRTLPRAQSASGDRGPRADHQHRGARRGRDIRSSRSSVSPCERAGRDTEVMRRSIGRLLLVAACAPSAASARGRTRDLGKPIQLTVRRSARARRSSIVLFGKTRGVAVGHPRVRRGRRHLPDRPARVRGRRSALPQRARAEAGSRRLHRELAHRVCRRRPRNNGGVCFRRPRGSLRRSADRAGQSSFLACRNGGALDASRWPRGDAWRGCGCGRRDSAAIRDRDRRLRVAPGDARRGPSGRCTATKRGCLVRRADGHIDRTGAALAGRRHPLCGRRSCARAIDAAGIGDVAMIAAALAALTPWLCTSPPDMPQRAAHGRRSRRSVSSWVHFVAIGIWFGGLAALLLGVAGTPSAEKTEATRRFSASSRGASSSSSGRASREPSGSCRRGAI